MRKVGKYLLILCLTAPPAAEIAARIIGWTALRNDDFFVEATPSPWIRGNAELGFELVPGTFDIVLNHTLRFQATHLPDGTRNVGAQKNGGPSLVFMGCSYTYGYGVNDEETFVARIQKAHPDWHVRNLSVPGFSTAQAYTLLNKMIQANEHPEILVLVHSSAHVERNVFANSWRKALKIGFKRSNEQVNQFMQGGRFPYYDVETGKMRTVAWDELYYNWPGRETFAIVNALQSSSESDIPEQDQWIGTLALVNKMEALCAAHGIRFVLLDLDNSALSASDLSSADVFAELHFDFSRRDLLNLPEDRHPSAKGHALLFILIDNILSPLLDE